MAGTEISVAKFGAVRKALLLEFEEVDTNHGSATEIMQVLHGQLQMSRAYEDLFADKINKRALKLEKMNRDELEFQTLNFTGRKKGRQPHCKSFSVTLAVTDRKQRGIVDSIRLHNLKILAKIDCVGEDVVPSDFHIND
jgi:hypothetical protein